MKSILSPLWLVAIGVMFASVTIVHADGPPTTLPLGKGKLVSLSALPAKVQIRGRDELQQLVIAGHYANGGVRDLTSKAKYQSANSKIVRIQATGLAVSAANGSTQIIAEFDGKSVAIPVIVESANRELPMNFTNDIVPIFSKLGCNSGACHGKSGGQNGFQMSLLGFVPQVDYDALVLESKGRRTLPAAPQASLLLLKSTGAMPHGGGAALETGSRDYQRIARWIASGMPFGKKSDPVVTGIFMAPAHRLIGLQSAQQITVTAHYSDGSKRDVTADAEYHTESSELLEVTGAGLVKTLDIAGEGSVMARFLGHVAVFRATIPQNLPSTRSQTAVWERVLKKPSNFVDEHIFAKLKQLGVPPSGLCTDSEFIRRASIDITGTLPTLEQVKIFLASTDSNKRTKLIDELLNRPDYASYFALKWGDILRNRRDGLVGVGGSSGRTEGLHTWIRDSLQKNTPYDKFVREILTARGNMYGKDGHPAVGWFNVLKTPQTMVDDTAQVFLGTRIQCAQCHHHPYEKWSQDDYWGMAAFFARVTLPKIKQKTPREFRNAKPVQIAKAGFVQNPQGKKYDKPRVLDGQWLTLAEGDDPRQKLAEWMVRPDNPYFARALANRYWAHFLGSGITHEPDDLRVTNPPSHPQLLDALAKDFIKSGFDIKHLIRTICASKTYQLSSAPNDYNKKSKQTFARFTPRRLPAEVMLDAIDQITGSPTKYSRSTAKRAIELPDETVPAQRGAKEFLQVFGKPKRDSSCECERITAASLTQSLYMVSSDELHRKLNGRTARAAKLATDKRSVNEKVTELFLRVFARYPTTREQKAAMDFLAKEETFARNEKSTTRQRAIRQEAYEDLIWALINTKEFMFNH